MKKKIIIAVICIVFWVALISMYGAAVHEAWGIAASCLAVVVLSIKVINTLIGNEEDNEEQN